MSLVGPLVAQHGRTAPAGRWLGLSAGGCLAGLSGLQVPDGDDGDHTVSTTYDAWGDVVTESTPAGPDPDANPVVSTTRYVTDAAGRTVAQIDGDGDPANALMTGYEYDAGGRMWRTIEHLDGTVDPADRYVIGVGDRVTETRYTPAGRTAAQVSPPPNAVTFDWAQPDAAKSITSYGYDSAGRQTTVTGPDGLDTVTAYDDAGGVDTVTTPGGYVTGYDYDDAGRTTTVRTPSGLTGPGDPATVQVDTTYTPTGLIATETDSYAPGVDVDPATRGFVYTPGGRVEVATDANDDSVSYDYDARGNRTVRHSLDEDADPIVETWDWDTADRLVAHQRPHAAGAPGPATVKGYDPDFGWLATVTDPTGRVESRRYYTDGTPKGETHTGPGLDTITVDRFIDSRGRPVRRRDQTGTATATEATWAYARDGQTVTAGHPGGRTVSYSWDLAGTISTVTHPDGSQGRYVHDSMGRVTDIAVAPTPAGVGVPLATMSYDDDGRLLVETMHGAGGSARGRSYDGAGHLTNYLQLWEQDAPGWDGTGQIFTWRTDGRMGSQINTTAAGNTTETYDYDPAGQLTTVTGGPSPTSVVYGPRGNRTEVTTGGATAGVDYNPDGSIAGYSTPGAGAGTFSYDAAGRRTAEATTDPGGNPVASTTLAYDAAGRTTRVAETTGAHTVANTRAWDGDDNLARLTHSETGVFPWTLDYLWDTTGPMARVLDTYLYGAIHSRTDYANVNIGIEVDIDGFDYQWYGYDALGSAVDPGDNPHLVDAPDRHDPWGNPTPDTTAFPQGTYRGQDRYGNLIHLRAREYHPGTGQFTTPDPLDGVDGTPTVANPYHYTDNDPLTKQDPTGMRPTDCTYSPGIRCDRAAEKAWDYMKQAEHDFDEWLEPRCSYLIICKKAPGITEIALEFGRRSRTDGAFDPKRVVINYLTSTNRLVDGVPLVDVGDKHYLYYHDVLGNVMWGRLAQKYMGFVPDGLILGCTHSCPGAGQTDAGDDVMVRAGLSLPEDARLDDVLRAIRSRATTLFRQATTPLYAANSPNNKIVPREG